MSKVVLALAVAVAITAAVGFVVSQKHATVATQIGSEVIDQNQTRHYVPNLVIMYHSFKKNNNLTFGASEDQRRFTVFQQNYKKVAEHNAKNSTYKLRMTSLAHLTQEEFAAIKLGYTHSTITLKKAQSVVLNTSNLPEEVDWTTKGAVTPVKDQKTCGSCWSFSSTGALEGLNYIKNNKLESLSEQELVDCSSRYGNQGCNGGLMDQAFQYVADNGISSEEAYPYVGTDGNCQTKAKVFTNKGASDVPVNDPDQLAAAVAQQPVSVAIEADTDAFQLYSEGVITGDACGTSLDHGVLAVGYGTLNNQAYFKVKNSWGPKWGQNGYVLIGKAGDAGVCGINSAASYPTL